MTRLTSEGTARDNAHRIDSALDLASELFHLATPASAHWTPAHGEDGGARTQGCTVDAQWRPHADFVDPATALTRSVETSPPLIARATVSQLHLTLSQRSLSALLKRTLVQSFALAPSPASAVLAASPPVVRSDDIKHVAFSPDGNRQAVFRVTPAREGKAERRTIEVVGTESGTVECEVEVKSDVHGDFYFDSAFALGSRID